MASAGWPCTNLTESRSAGRTTLINTRSRRRRPVQSRGERLVRRHARRQSTSLRRDTPTDRRHEICGDTTRDAVPGGDRRLRNDRVQDIGRSQLSQCSVSEPRPGVVAQRSRQSVDDALRRPRRVGPIQQQRGVLDDGQDGLGPAASTRNRSKMGWMLCGTRAAEGRWRTRVTGAAAPQSFGCARTHASKEGRTTSNNVRSVKHSLYSTSAFCASNIEVKLPKNAAAKEGSLDGSASSSLRAATAGAWKRGQPRNAAASKRDCGCTARERDTASRIREGSCEGSSCCRREHALRCPYRLSHPCKALEPVKTSHSTQPKEKTSHAGAATRSPVFVSSGDVYSSFGSPVSSPQ